MNAFGPQGGGFERKPSCPVCGSADPGTCFCKSNPSNGAWGGGSTPMAAGSGVWGGIPNGFNQPQMPEKVHIIVDSHIYEVNCDGTPIGQLVHAIKTQRN